MNADRDRGSIPMAVLIGVGIIVFMIIGLAVCTDVLLDDADEENDLGQSVASALVMDRRDGDEGSRNKNGDSDCRDSRGPCEDNDASPSFEDSPVRDSFDPTICVFPGSCPAPS